MCPHFNIKVCPKCTREVAEKNFNFGANRCFRCVPMSKNRKNNTFINPFTDGRKLKPKQSKKDLLKKQRKYVKRRRKKDPAFKIAANTRVRINQAIKKGSKTCPSLYLLGCSVKMFKEQLFLKMEIGMTFENYGEWEIDHIRPCSSFDLTLPEEQKKCFHFSNTRPLWKDENRSKGNRYLE